MRNAHNWRALCSHTVSTLEVNLIQLGNMMRKHRLKSGKSLRGVARHLNISPAYLSDCELGRRMLSIDTLQRFIDYCK